MDEFFKRIYRFLKKRQKNKYSVWINQKAQDNVKKPCLLCNIIYNNKRMGKVDIGGSK